MSEQEKLINTRKPRFNDNYYDIPFKEFKKNPKPLWEIGLVTIIMVINGITFTAIYDTTEGYRALIIALWVVIGICSVLFQACFYTEAVMLEWLDCIFVWFLGIIYGIVFIPIAEWYSWVVAALAVSVFLILQVYRSYESTTVLTIIYLVNAWHIMVIITTILLYTTSSA